MRVEDILRRKGADVATIAPEITVEAALHLLNDMRIGALVVSTAAEPIAGIVSERDIVRAFAARGAAVLHEAVEQIMTTTVVTCTPDELLTDVMSAMTEHRFRHMPVTDDGRLAGIVSIGDVVKNRLEELETETTELRAYIASA